MHIEVHRRFMSRRMTDTKGSTGALRGFLGFVRVEKGLVSSGYLHTLRRSRLEGIIHEGLLARGEAEPDGKQCGGPGAAPAPPHRPAAPRAPSPRPDAHAAQGGGRGGL